MAEYASLRKIEFELCGGNLPEKYKAFVRRVLNDRNLIPAADVAPVVHGRLIDADAILKADENSDKALVLGSGKALEIAYALLKKKVEDAPTVDAVVVTRCKDCKHYDMGVCLKIYSDGNVHSAAWQSRNPYDICSYGERKDGKDG